MTARQRIALHRKIDAKYDKLLTRQGRKRNPYAVYHQYFLLEAWKTEKERIDMQFRAEQSR